MGKSDKVYMILTNGFDPDVRVYKEAKYLVTQGFDVSILAWDRKCEYKDKEEENIDGIKVKRFFIPSIPGTGLKQMLPYFKFIKEIRKYLNKEEYKYLHCHDFDGIIVGLATKKGKNKKLIFDMHEIYTHYSYSKNILFNKIFSQALKISDHIIYVNNDQIMQITNKDKLVFLPNYPEKVVYLPIEKTNKYKFRINYIGTVRDYDSLTTLAELANTGSELDIGIYGTGVSLNKLKENYNSSSITFYGKYDGIRDSGKIYRNTDILYCVYNPEVKNWKNAYPVKLFEAIITKTPIIVAKDTKVGDFVERNEIGETVEFGNIKSLKDKVQKITCEYNKYQANLLKIKDKYNWENVVKNLDKIYEII